MNDKIERITDKTLLVGIDIAKRMHWAQITNHRGVSLCKPIKVANSAEGFSLLAEKVAQIKKEFDLTDVMIGFEPSGHYWRTLAWYFKTSDAVLLGVNPYHVKQVKELEDNAQTKSDKKDALVIAHLLRDGRYFDIYMPEDEYADLRILRRHRDHLADRRKWAYNLITTVLDEYFPEFESVGFHVSTKSTRTILRSTPFPSDIIAIGVEKLREKWLEHSIGRNTSLSKRLATELFAVAKSSIAVTTGLTTTRMRINHLLDQLDLLDTQINDCEEKMDEVIERLDIGDYLKSVPGVGNITGASLIAETGDLNRFENWRQVRKLAGLNLVEQSSGQHKGKTHISKRGRPALRCIIYQIGDKGMLVSAEMQQYYQYLRHRQSNQLKHTQAVLAVGLKLLRIIFHVVKHREHYDPAKSLGEVRLGQIKNVA